MIDYGPHSDTLYTIVTKETGECWQMSHKDFRVKSNVSLGIRGDYQNGNSYNGKRNTLENDPFKKKHESTYRGQ